MHSLDVNFQLLRLAELPSTEVAERACTLRIRCTSIGSMHFQVVQAQEEFLAVLTLICALAVVQLLGVLHDVVFAQDGHAAYFTVIFPDRKAEARVVEDRTMCAIVKRMIEA